MLLSPHISFVSGGLVNNFQAGSSSDGSVKPAPAARRDFSTRSAIPARPSMTSPIFKGGKLIGILSSP
jgi:hypothetical protein